MNKETITYKDRTFEIIQDEDARNPQEDSDTGLFIIAKHDQFYVPAPGEKRINQDPDVEKSPFLKTHWIFPLEAYIHSGVRLAFGNEGNFPDRRWDVSQVGWVFASKKEWRLSAKARAAAESLIETWNQYLSGDVWGYDTGEDSCWGFYGRDYCIEQAKEAIDAQLKREAAKCHDLQLVTA
jgi:hypothetical protein